MLLSHKILEEGINMHCTHPSLGSISLSFIISTPELEKNRADSNEKIRD